MLIFNNVYKQFVEPKSLNKDDSRRELIFNWLVISLILLVSIAFIISLLRVILGVRETYHINPIIPGVILTLIIIFYAAARRRFSKYHVIVLILLHMSLGTFALFMYGYLLTQGLLLYVLSVILAGLLVSSRAAVLFMAVVLIELLLLHFLQIHNISKPNQSGYPAPLDSGDIIISIAIFVKIFFVIWLYGREIEHTLRQLRISEQKLKQNSKKLEVKVKERTKELERTQAEQEIEIYRFAEFGKLSSSLLHDLANPLMAVSMNFYELANKSEKSELVDHIQKGIISMESYVASARNELNKYRDVRTFDTAAEIQQLTEMYSVKFSSYDISCKLKLQENLRIKGDSSKFCQLVGNLVGNAVDVLSVKDGDTPRVIKIITRSKNSMAEIIVEDNGDGIDPDILDSIFKPFFSTKPKDIGTGIGLSIVVDVVNELNGTITVNSTKGKTKFKVMIPIDRS